MFCAQSRVLTENVPFKGKAIQVDKYNYNPVYFCQWYHKCAQHISLECAPGEFYFLFFKL